MQSLVALQVIDLNFAKCAYLRDISELAAAIDISSVHADVKLDFTGCRKLPEGCRKKHGNRVSAMTAFKKAHYIGS